MVAIAQFAYAFAVGLTLAGIAGTLLEIVIGRRIGFRPPFVMPGRFGRSLVLTMLAGPLMLANEAIAAKRVGLIQVSVFVICLAVAVVWSTATGVLLVELALVGGGLLG